MNNKILIIFTLLLTGFLFFSFKIKTIPPGLETDEGSIVYNSVLISRTLRDQNNRFLPIFILSSDKIDWKQPVLIYLTALFFKLFGESLFIYKSVNIVISLTSGIILYLICNLLFKNKKYSLLSFFIYITTPIIFITTRVGNESILPSLISTVWLYSLLLYKKNKKIKNIIINSIVLGIGFYSFKGMRIIIPVWSLISFIFIYKENWDTKKSLKINLFNSQIIKKILAFVICLLPFFLLIPLLELKYSGSIFDRQSISISSVYNFFYYWLSNISFSFWFTTPDIGRVYTISEFGAIPLFYLLFFVIGIINSIIKKTNFRFIFLCFLATPILFGIAHSTDYTHRLIALIPFIIIIILYGIKIAINFLNINHPQSIIKTLLIVPILINLFGFYKFYFINYPKLNTTSQAFGKYTYSSFKKLSEVSKMYNLIPYVEEKIYNSEGDENRFYNLILFKDGIKIWKLGENIPSKSVLLTNNEKIDNFTTLDISLPNEYHLLRKND